MRAENPDQEPPFLGWGRAPPVRAAPSWLFTLFPVFRNRIWTRGPKFQLHGPFTFAGEPP